MNKQQKPKQNKAILSTPEDKGFLEVGKDLPVEPVESQYVIYFEDSLTAANAIPVHTKKKQPLTAYELRRRHRAKQRGRD